ncbi:MAG: hypothetical protein M3511_11705 [Deinococcota bacterium]|jgi:DNA-binding SARP family transcriptional activator|nr:hypothetical protein [Deinococcota bacterium]
MDLPLVEEIRRGLHERTVNFLFEAAQRVPGGLAEDCLKRALKLEPLHEPALQAYLKLLLERGRRTEALRRYRIFAEHLKKDVGLEPLLETRRIVQSWPGDIPRLTQDY